MIEQYLVKHSAPTLAGIKTGNLFNYTFGSREELYGINILNERLNQKGVFIEVLFIQESSALIYVYRKRLLQRDMMDEKRFQVLKSFGYKSSCTDECITCLKEHIKHMKCSSGFPHEIGLFLGYPVEDVIGFIENRGRNYHCSGCWKVYNDVCEAVKLFRKFNKCKDIYIRLFQEGRSIEQLTAA